MAQKEERERRDMQSGCGVRRSEKIYHSKADQLHDAGKRLVR